MSPRGKGDVLFVGNAFQHFWNVAISSGARILKRFVPCVIELMCGPTQFSFSGLFSNSRDVSHRVLKGHQHMKFETD